MNYSATDLPHLTAMPGNRLVAAFSAVARHQSKLREWAFAAAVRLSDQDKPILLKLLVELAIVVRMLACLARSASQSAGRTRGGQRAPRSRSAAGVRAPQPRSRPSAASERRTSCRASPGCGDVSVRNCISIRRRVSGRVRLGASAHACERRHLARTANDRPSHQGYPHLHSHPRL